MKKSRIQARTTVLVLSLVVAVISLVAWPIAHRIVYRTLTSLQVENNKQQAIRFANSLDRQLQETQEPQKVLDNFQEVLDNLPKEESGFVCLIGPETEVAAHPNPGKIGTSMKTASRENLDGVRTSFQTANLEGIAGGGIFQPQNGIAQIVYQVPVPGIDWLMSVHLDQEAVLQRVDRIMRTLILIALPSAILVVIVGSFFVRATSRHYELKLEKANSQLEQKVKQRTHELQANLEELQQTKDKLKQSEKMSFLGRLVAGIAHEINNPLSVIGGYVELLSLQLELSSEQKKAVRRIANAAERCKRLVVNMLSFSRKEALKTEPHAIASIVATVIELLDTEIRKSNTEIKLELLDDCRQIQVDRLQIEQVLFNLVKNAIQAMEHQKEKQIILHSRDLGNRVCISISDNGPGIPETQLNQLFQAFFTSKDQGKGTGLGLFLCDQFIKAHKGKISASSQVGKGTTFDVELPAVG